MSDPRLLPVGCQFCGHPTFNVSKVCDGPRCRFKQLLPKAPPSPPVLLPGPVKVIVGCRA